MKRIFALTVTLLFAGQVIGQEPQFNELGRLIRTDPACKLIQQLKKRLCTGRW